jgi:hypothetical protein
MVQKEMFELSGISEDGLHHLGHASAEARGAIHTRPEVVEFILDLVGWKHGNIPLSARLLEPSAGHGDFLIPAARRLLESHPSMPLTQLKERILATEVSASAAQECRERVLQLAQELGRTAQEAQSLSKAWVRQADFLTQDLACGFTHIVGNPPYLRLEALPKSLLNLYRTLWASLYDRADLYVAFIEKSLSLLGSEGRLGFICADRWMRNRYGKILRERVSNGFHLEVNVDFTGCPAFLTEVDAYPSVFTIRKGSGSTTRTFSRPEVSRTALSDLALRLTSPICDPSIEQAQDVVKGDRPWVLNQSDKTKVLRDLEERYPTLEEAGCKVGIGVATGADAIFIGPESKLDVEKDRKVPLIGTGDIHSGQVIWSGNWVLNPFEPDGSLAPLPKYPRFERYVQSHAAALKARNVAIRNPNAWYRTIDRIHADLVRTPKLLVPDIKGSAHVVVDLGGFYPHHNLYYILPGEWPIHALAEVLRSRIAYGFVELYCPPLRGGFLRFQAQYLRRIRLPRWATLPRSLQAQLQTPNSAEDLSGGIREAFGLTSRQWARLQPTNLQS